MRIEKCAQRHESNVVFGFRRNVKTGEECSRNLVLLGRLEGRKGSKRMRRRVVGNGRSRKHRTDPARVRIDPKEQELGRDGTEIDAAVDQDFRRLALR
jgi:hypothetical protein